jgi:DNA-binding transcriptional regulator YiaG
MEGRAIRALRKQFLNWSQENFARKLRISPVTVGRWESGKSKPSLSDEKKIRKIFDGVVQNKGEHLTAKGETIETF